MHSSRPERRSHPAAARALRLWLAVAGCAACAGCAPPDAVYDLVGNTEDACGPGSVAEISDDFDDDSKGPSWVAYADATSSVAEVNQQVEMFVDGSLRAFAGYAWIGGYRSLRDCHVSVQVKEVGAPSSSVITYLSVPAEGDVGDIAISHSGSSLTMDLEEGGERRSQTVPYDPAAHARWRIREAGGTIHFETSEEGLVWVPRHSTPTPAFAGSVSVNVGMGVAFDGVEGGSVIVDNLNVVP